MSRYRRRWEQNRTIHLGSHKPVVECHFAKASQLYKIVNVKQGNNNNIFNGVSWG